MAVQKLTEPFKGESVFDLWTYVVSAIRRINRTVRVIGGKWEETDENIVLTVSARDIINQASTGGQTKKVDCLVQDGEGAFEEEILELLYVPSVEP